MKWGRRIISNSGKPPANRARLIVTHRTSYHFPDGAARLLLQLRLWPEPHAGQIVRKWEVSVNGAAVEPAARTGHGDQVTLWSASHAPGEAAILATGIIETEDMAGLVKGLNSRPNPAIFLRPTDLTLADKAIRTLVTAPAGPDQTIAWLHALMGTVHEKLRYVTGSTSVDTSAIEAMKAGEGVCQDQAHVFIAAARANGIPARYVCGYLWADGLLDDLHETHAWAEAWVEGTGWIAFDPSAGICPTERYVRLTTGLDSRDAAPIRGHAVGGSALGLVADVRIAKSRDTGTGEGRHEAMLRAQQQQQSQ